MKSLIGIGEVVIRYQSPEQQPLYQSLQKASYVLTF